MVDLFLEVLFSVVAAAFEGVVRAPISRAGCYFSLAAIGAFGAGMMLFVAGIVLGETQFTANPGWWSGTLCSLSALCGLVFVASGLACWAFPSDTPGP